jgi:hypothetical protein
VVKTLADPAVRKRLTDIGQEIYSPEQLTPAALAAFQKADKWWPIIKAAGIRAQGRARALATSLHRRNFFRLPSVVARGRARRRA